MSPRRNPVEEPDVPLKDECDFDRIDAHMANTDSCLDQFTNALAEITNQLRILAENQADAPRVQEPPTGPPTADQVALPANAASLHSGAANFKFDQWRKEEVSCRDYWGSCRRAAHTSPLTLTDAFLVTQFEVALTASCVTWATRFLNRQDPLPSFAEFGQAFCNHFEASTDALNTPLLLQAIPVRFRDFPTKLAEFQRLASRSSMSESAKLQALHQWIGHFRTLSRHMLACKPTTLDEAATSLLTVHAAEIAADAINNRGTTSNGSQNRPRGNRGQRPGGNNGGGNNGGNSGGQPGNRNGQGNPRPQTATNQQNRPGQAQHRYAQLNSADANTNAATELLTQLDAAETSYDQ